jgi:glycosyltransferase involved in cell wall biosynthesis
VATLEYQRKLRLALVLWNGHVGGAEVLSAKLAERMRSLGADVSIVFVGDPGPLVNRLVSMGVPYSSLGFGRGRELMLHPLRYAKHVARVGPDGALLVERGFMAATLRAGGFKGSIVAVEHGTLLAEPRRTKLQRLTMRINRLSGVWATNAEVAVSDFMLDRIRQHPHAKRLSRIYNGIDPNTYLPGPSPAANVISDLIVGFAGRLILGKGADHLIRAVGKMHSAPRIRLLIAGDGPERSSLVSLAEDLGVVSRVQFLGIVDDIPAFWRRCDVASVPSDVFVESFSMVTLEAMTCGKPIIASRNGAISELIVDGKTGTLVRPGNVADLVDALSAYANDSELRLRHGVAARARAMQMFHIDNCAQAYLKIFDELHRES